MVLMRYRTIGYWLHQINAVNKSDFRLRSFLMINRFFGVTLLTSGFKRRLTFDLNFEFYPFTFRLEL
jgi:hypothetical protein